jgi:hypothetical protein
VVFDLYERYGAGLMMSFSKYFHRPQTVFDERETFSLNIEDVTPSVIEQEITNLRPDWELAMNSLVVDARGRTWHLPMVDFLAVEFEQLSNSAFVDVIGRDIVKDLIFFNSGRSFHAYSTELLKPKDWVRFMGRLLLLNLPNSAPVVDTRWIGHRLIGGYCALRWSAHSSYHSASPRRVQSWKSSPSADIPKA